ncbi:uncharacterized protein LOC143637453 [Bidens hawaiensis]|uniref:uncharacterized protein LOC143637453 n=1 Tax=Bidens hawaiensis TaxID=980011 RepID=UPI00404A763C
MADNTSPSIPIPVFKGSSYEHWSIRIKTILRSRDLWDLVESGVEDKEKNGPKRDAYAMAIIQQVVQSIKLQGLRRDFENLCMKDDESVGEYFSQVMEIVSLRMSFGESVTDQTIVEKILRSLTSHV